MKIQFLYVNKEHFYNEEKKYCSLEIRVFFLFFHFMFHFQF